nr:MAG TPA: ATP synthase [Caudoviricetes sp.]
MRKTKKEQKEEGEVGAQTAIFSRFYNFINSIDYKKHFKYVCWLILADIILFIILTITFIVMTGNAFDGLS